MTATPLLTSGSIEAFQRYMSDRGLSPNTVRAYRADLTDLLTASTHLPLMTLRECEDATASWLTAGRVTWSPKTTGRKLTAVRAWARYIGHREFLLDYKLPSPGTPVPHPLPEGMDGIYRMLAATKNMDERVLIALCGLCATRVGEALTITARSFDLQEKTLTIVKGKGNKQRTIPVRTDAWPWLIDAIATKRDSLEPLVKINERWARRLIISIGKRAGLSRPTPSHDLRATLATAMYRASKDIRAVQEFLGHESVETTQIYTGVAQEQMRAAVEAA